MRKYLAPNDIHQITIPVIVGAEYTVPTGDAKLIVRTDGVDVVSTIPMADASDIAFDLTTPAVLAGELKLISYMLSAPTPVGRFQYRETVGVVDLLDIPTNADDVRNHLGLNLEELADENIDYVEAYLKYYTTLNPEFHTLRLTNQYLTKRFGDMIAISTALELAPSLITRLDKKRVTENGDFSRFGDAKHLADLIAALENKLADVMDDLTEYVAPEVVALTPLFQFVPMYQHSIGQ